ncbi:PREDICTED: proximal tubules-expressed gene protein-like [Nanorana parkeri]|uniref:proximal tubules-expressed gene protein-like n=1 Tax=Nanorana parkeri TaxID=125878 RepID=UPI000854851B|nr:PREDICTED: proximal tubules-expressed gene protein-like [Nanorana parkeri]
MLRLELAFLLLVSLGCISCQSGANKEVRRIPQWGTGLIAVTVFLFLVLVFYVANILWNKRSKSNLESISMGKFEDGAITNGSTGRYITISSDHERVQQHAYVNPIQITDNELSTPM